MAVNGKLIGTGKGNGSIRELGTIEKTKQEG
jgi:hypothetical protein